MKKIWLTLIPLGILIAALYNNCRGPTLGTTSPATSGAAGSVSTAPGGGSPAVPTQGSSTETGSPEPSVARTCLFTVVKTSCQTLQRCYAGVTLDACITSAEKSKDFAQVFGPRVAPLKNLQTAINAEANGALICNRPNLPGCQQQISQLRCDSQEVKSSYTPDAGDPFLFMYNLLGR
jgi:hypothetical protein